MLVKPIPRRLLRHEVLYKPYIGDGRHGAVWGEEISLRNICVDYDTDYRIRGKSQTIRYRAVLYYDCVNSFPRDIAFKEKDKVVFNGAEMTVEGICVPNTPAGKAHHYELGLV